MSEGHYTSKAWHFIDAGNGKWVIKCDTSYATAGVMECLWEPPGAKHAAFMAKVKEEVDAIYAERSDVVASTASEDSESSAC